NANAPYTGLTAVTLSTAPYIAIYDDTGRQLTYCSAASRCSVGGSVPNNSARTFVAYVSQDYPDGSPPSSTLAASAPVTVTNVGYTGTVSLTADQSTVNANSPYAGLRATTSLPIPSPYYLSIYDDTGQRLTYCNSGSICSIGGSIPNGASRTFTAYV